MTYPCIAVRRLVPRTRRSFVLVAAALLGLAALAGPAAASLPPLRAGAGATDWTTFMSPTAPTMVRGAGTEIWSATSAGLRGYDTQTQQWRSYFRANGLPADRVTTLALDDSARVWVGTAASDLARLARSGDVEIVPQALLNLPAGGVTALAIAGDSLWIASPQEIGLLRLSLVQRITVSDPLARAQRGIRALLALKPGEAGATERELWVGGDQGVIRLVGSTWSSAQAGLVPGDPIIGFTLGEGSVWAASLRRMYRWTGVSWVVETQSFTRIFGLTGTASSVTVADTAAVFQHSIGGWTSLGAPGGLAAHGVALDASGTLYVGTESGLARFCALCAAPTAWTLLRAPGGRAVRVSDQSGTRIAFDAGDNPWISTKFGGIARFHAPTHDWRNYGAAEGLGDDAFYFGAYTARDGSLWFSNWGQGVVHVTPVADTFAFELIPPTAGGLTVPWAMGIGQDGDGRMWFAHDNDPGAGFTYGIDIFAPPSTWQRAYTGNQPMANDRVWAVTFDTFDRAWIGYRPGGVQVWDWRGSGAWKTVDLSRLGSQQDCYMILTDKSNAWLATAEGLARVSLNAVQFSGSSVQFYTTASGLPSSDVRAVSFGPGNALYVATAQGIAVMRGDGGGGYSVTETITQQNSGLLSNRILAMAWDPHKKAMWVAGPDGVSRYMPSSGTGGGGGTPKATTLAVRPNPARYGNTNAIKVTGFSGAATVTIYSIDGQRVASRSVNALSSTDAVIIWDGRDGNGTRMPPGMYIARVAGDAVSARAIVSIAP